MRAAVIGTGYMGKTYIGILRNIVDRLVICSADTQTGRTLAEDCGGSFYEDYQQMLQQEQLDFVAVCVPTYLHCQIVEAAIARKIPVLCEKPFTLVREDALRLFQAAKRQQVPLMVAHCLRFAKPYVYLKRCIQDGRFGKLRLLHMHRDSAAPGWSPDNWFANVRRSGGIIRDLHIHDTDMAVNLLGIPLAVHTSCNTGSCTTVFSYPGDVVVTASASWRSISGFPFRAGYDAVFEKASLVFEQDTLELYVGDQVMRPLEMEAFSQLLQSDDPVENELRYFCHCLQTGAELTLCDPTESVQTIYVSCTQSDSAESGSIVEINIPEEIRG